jgi:hypothetical protein
VINGYRGGASGGGRAGGGYPLLLKKFDSSFLPFWEKIGVEISPILRENRTGNFSDFERK